MDQKTAEFIDQLKKYGRSEALRPRAGWRAGYEDQKLIKERRYELGNVCPRCRLVKARNGKCSMGCDE
jgi:flagellar biosynthesis/type III secretory pathway chaperone